MNTPPLAQARALLADALFLAPDDLPDDAALGDTPENLFARFDEVPFAAASIGQVHRALTKEGVECVVKIQYPGVKESCDSDLKHLKRLLKLAGLVKVSADVMDKTFEEIRKMLYEELDYKHEAENLKLFGEYYRDHPYIRLPDLIENLSAETVLTLTLRGQIVAKGEHDPAAAAGLVAK